MLALLAPLATVIAMHVDSGRDVLRLSTFLAILALLAASFLTTDAWAGTRRAFVVGVQRYDDAGLQPLSRPVNDATDLAKDLEDAGFPHENIKLGTDFRTKADFMKSLNDFLNLVKPGDEVLFFFSGHGYGSSDGDVNYLLFGGTRSLLTFTRDRLQKSIEKQDKDQAKDTAAVRLRQRDFEINYEIDEIKSAGVSEEEVQNQIMAKNPATLLMFLDACRTLALAENKLPGAASMTGLHTHKRGQKGKPAWLKPGVAIVYSASEGEAAVERLDALDGRRNSLFTDLLRINIQRPGVEWHKFAAELSKQVDEVAMKRLSIHQKPDYVDNLTSEFRFIPSVGAERFPLPEAADPCYGSQADLAAAKKDDKSAEDRLITHIYRYAQCGSVDEAKAELSRLRAVAGTFVHPSGDCDDLAASPYDPSLRGKSGVPIEQIGRLDPPRDHVRQAGEPDEFDTKYVIDVCADAVKEHPRIARYALNLARAEHAHALNPRNSEKVRAEYLERARFDYERLAEAGEPLAMANLVAAYDEGVGDAALDGKTSGIDPKNALKLLSQAAQQGLALAQFRLANLYLSGWPEAELQSDLGEYRHWMGLAARQGYVAAIVAEASSERLGVGTNRRNPVLAAELFKRAARLGSNEAEFQLGLIYLSGATGDSDQAASGQQDSKKDKASSQALQDLDDPNSVASDDEQALIWFGRAADHGNAAASLYMSYLLENARGVKDPQPQIAARYLRAAAEAGNADAQVDYVNKIFDGTILLRFDDADEVIDTLLKRAMKAGNGRAALLLAARAWPDDPHLHRDARLAAAYAFAAIDLAAMANPAGDYWQNDFSPLTEIAAGHFLIMLAHQPDGTDEQGKPLFSKAETDLLEKYYGKYDETQHRVVVKMADFFDYANAVPQDSTVRKQLWIWDWGRVESPTEQQFRRIELWRGTTFYDHVRDSYFLKERNDVNTMKSHPEYVTQNMLRTAIGDVYSLSRNIKTSFVELLGNKLEIIGRQP